MHEVDGLLMTAPWDLGGVDCEPRRKNNRLYGISIMTTGNFLTILSWISALLENTCPQLTELLKLECFEID